MIYYDANDRASLPVSTAVQNGVAGTNIGIILQPNRTYDFPITTARQIGLLTTEAGANVSFMLYQEEV